MRILHILGNTKLPKSLELEAVSGAVQSTLELAWGQVDLGHEVWVTSTGTEPWEDSWHGIKLIMLGERPEAQLRTDDQILDLSLHIPLMLLTREQDFDVLHAQSYPCMDLFRGKIKVIHCRNDPFYTGLEDNNVAFNRERFGAIIGRTDVQIAVSQFVAKQLERLLPNKNNIAMVYDGIQLERFKPKLWQGTRHTIREALGLHDNDILFLFAGAIVPQKGVIHLAKAFVALSRENANVYLALAGDSDVWRRTSVNDPYELQIKKILEPVKAKVHFLGKVPPKDIPGVYAATDVAVVPSVWQEAFGRVAVEALASGKPVIASNTGGLKEIVSKTNGILVTPGDEDALKLAMQKLCQDENLRLCLQSAAIKTVQQFSWRRVVGEIDSVYERVLVEKSSI